MPKREIEYADDQADLEENDTPVAEDQAEEEEDDDVLDVPEDGDAQDLGFQTETVKIRRGSKIFKYKLKELDGDGREKYLEDLGSRQKYNPQGNAAGFKRWDGFTTHLLSLCLYDDRDHLVKEATLKKWPSRVLENLHERAAKLSGLDKGAEDRAGND